MNRSEFELLLREAGALCRESDFIVFGSQAVLGWLEKPPRSLLVSFEADLYPRNHPAAAVLIRPRLGLNSPFYRKHGFYADSVTPELATFPDGWTDRLIPFSNKNTGGVTAWCVEIHDITVSKLAAGRPKDARYILALLRHELITVKTLRTRIDLLPSESDQRRLHAAFDELLKQFRRGKKAATTQRAKPVRRKK